MYNRPPSSLIVSLTSSQILECRVTSILFSKQSLSSCNAAFLSDIAGGRASCFNHTFLIIKFLHIRPPSFFFLLVAQSSDSGTGRASIVYSKKSLSSFNATFLSDIAGGRASYFYHDSSASKFLYIGPPSLIMLVIRSSDPGTWRASIVCSKKSLSSLNVAFLNDNAGGRASYFNNISS